MIPKAIEYRNFFYLGIFLEILIIAISLFEADSQLAFLQTASRYSGRLSFFFFSIIFIHAAIFPKVDESLSTILFHRSFVVYFAILHLIHFGFLASYNILADTVLIPTRLIGGIIAYVTLVLYPIILLTALQGKWVSVVRNLYIYFLFFVFFMTYLPRIKGELPEVSGRIETYYALFVILIVFFALHLALRVVPSFRKWVRALPAIRSY